MIKSPIFDSVMRSTMSEGQQPIKVAPVKLSEASEPMFNTNGLAPVGKGPEMGPGSPNMTQNKSYLDKLLKYESSGNYQATNKSGATGGYQFFESTAKPYLDKMGKSWDDFKGDSDLQDDIADQWTETNRNGLSKAGIEPTDLNLWVAHNQGLQGAKNLLGKGKINTKNIKANLPTGTKPTAENYLAYWSKRF